MDDGPESSHPGDYKIDITCYPSPTNSRVNIEVTANSRDEVVLDIYNITGQKVREIKFGYIQGKVTKSIDVSSMSSGIYFIRRQNAIESSSSKFVLLK